MSIPLSNPVPQVHPVRRVLSNAFALIWDWLACFRSVQLAIVLLSLMAVGTLIGVLMPQEGLVDVVEIKRTYGDSYRILKAMGLFNVYSSYWYIALEVLFFFNMLFGSFQWLKPAYLSATRKTFCGPEHILASPNHFAIPVAGATLEQVTEIFKKGRYSVYQSGDKLYATKGNFSRFAPVVAHSGILLLIVGCVYGTFTGFKAQQLAVPGQTFAVSESQAFIPNVNPAIWQGSVPDLRVHVNDFRIEYYPEDPTTPQQYYADLSILDPADNVLKRETISVNHPLSIGDLTIYQASFRPTGKLLTDINGTPQALEVNTEMQDRPVSMTLLENGQTLITFPFLVQQDPGVTENYVVMFLKDDNGFVGAAPGQMPENLRLREGESGQIGEVNITYHRTEMATGLQMKKAPEVAWVYAAFIIIILGTLMCIVSQRQLWAVFSRDENGQPLLLVRFKTNKARLSFMKELVKLETMLNQQLNKRSLGNG